MNVDKIIGKLDREGVSIVKYEDIENVFRLKEMLEETSQEKWGIEYIMPGEQEQFSDSNVIYLATKDSDIHIINPGKENKSAAQISREGENIVYVTSNIQELKKSRGRWNRIKDFVTEV